MRQRLVALLALVMLSGCSDPSGPGASTGSGDGKGTGPSDDAALSALAPLRLDADVPLNGTVAIDDTFPLTDTCNSNPARGCVERTHDLGTRLPAGIPMEVAVEVAWAPGDGIFHMEAWVDGEGMQWLRVDNTSLQPGLWRWTALLVPGPESSAFVISGGPQSAGQTESPYHLEVSFMASNQTVPALIPVAVALGPNGTLRAESPNGDPVQFLLYGPDDAFLHEVDGNVTLPADARRGDYIAMPRERARFLVPGGGDLRFVGVTFANSDEVAIPPSGGASVDVASPTPPFLAGAYYYGQRDTPIMAAVDLQFTLTDPDGAALVTESACQPFCLGGFSASWSTGFGTSLKAGSYTLTVDSQGGHDTYAGVFLARFDRSSL